MRTVKIAVTLDQDLVARLDQLVEENQFPSRSRAVQEAVRDKLQRLQRSRLARESAKLDPAFEQALADEGLNGPDVWAAVDAIRHRLKATGRTFSDSADLLREGRDR